MSGEGFPTPKVDENDAACQICPKSSSLSTAPSSLLPSDNKDAPSPSTETSAATFLIEDYECMLCLGLLYEPTTLKCGHSFCRTCVEDLYQQNHAKCPTCRQVLPIVHHYSSEKMSIAPSFSLCKFLQTAFPAQYEERRKEIMEMYPSSYDQTAGDVDAEMNTTTTTNTDGATNTTPLPLFYLDPMVPRQVMQLNIFEHRYLLMISRCLEGSRHFGMVGFMSQRMTAERRRRRMRQAESMSSASSPLTSSTNTTSMDQDDEEDDDDALSMSYGVEVEIIESSPQLTGTMHIQVKAKRRFKIVGETWSQDGYAMANVQWLSLPLAQSCTNAASTVPIPLASHESQNNDRGDNVVLEGDESPSVTAAISDWERDDLQPHGESPSADPSENDNFTHDPSSQVVEMAQSLGPLVEEWKALVVAEGWQRYHGQLAQTINAIGPMPEANDIRGAVDRALWITALINPLPGMGVAPEIRPDVLETAAVAVDGNYVPLLLVVTHGMRKSIEYLTPNAVVVWMQYQLQKVYCILIGRGTRRLGPSPPLPGTHQMVNALLRLLVVCLVLGFFWQRILTPKTKLTLAESTPAEVVLNAASERVPPIMGTESTFEL